jgi:hypothetical protein
VRLHLIAFAWNTAFAGGQNEVATRVDVYEDGWMLIVVPAAHVAQHVEKTTVSASYSLDVLSGATQAIPADTLTSATWYRERRHQVDLAVDARPSETYGFGLHGSTSVEPDYQSFSGGVSATTDVMERAVTLTARYDMGVETVTVKGNGAPIEQRRLQKLDLSWSQILSRKSVGTVLVSGAAYECGESLGCLASPYRFVPLRDDSGGLVTVHERTPSRLLRLAVAGRVAHAFNAKTALHGGYRFYQDSWAVFGHTVDVALTRLFAADRLALKVTSRGALQSPASFYRDNYDVAVAEAGVTVPKYRTADREYAGVRSVRVGGRAAYTFDGFGPFETFAVDARLERGFYRYPYFSEQPRRNVWMYGTGVEATW